MSPRWRRRGLARGRVALGAALLAWIASLAGAGAGLDAALWWRWSSLLAGSPAPIAPSPASTGLLLATAAAALIAAWAPSGPRWARLLRWAALAALAALLLAALGAMIGQPVPVIPALLSGLACGSLLPLAAHRSLRPSPPPVPADASALLAAIAAADRQPNALPCSLLRLQLWPEPAATRHTADALALLARRARRPGDVVARLSSCECALLLAGTDHATALGLRHDLHAELAHLLVLGGLHCSIGVATHAGPAGGTDPAALFNAAAPGQA